ncbi:DNA sulfur modification protein DndB [Nocardia sp. NPDC051463]|uniref:DNA sulfur modification protein DndB n=1 Tax=Nocardia sp. NPDC051463 TaxID=3154845 RepID=UPI00344B3AE5
MSDDAEGVQLAPSVDIDALRGRIGQPIKLQKNGIRTWAGKMEKIVFTATMKEIGEHLNFDRLLERRDFDIESQRAGNRDVADTHWKKIEAFLLETDRPFLGMLTVAMPRDQVTIEELSVVGMGSDLVKLTIYADAENPVMEDGQHRNMAIAAAWRQVRDLTDDADPRLLKARRRLADASVTIEMLFEDDPDVLSTIFVQMASTKPISPSLIAVMDKTSLPNRLGSYVMSNSDLFKDSSVYLSTKAARALAKEKGQSFDPLYAAAAVRNTAANIAGVGVRDRTPEQRENILRSIVEQRQLRDGLGEAAALTSVGDEVVATIDYAYRNMPGWRDVANGESTISAFKEDFVHGAASGLYTVATALAAARVAGVSPELVIDVMAESIPWRRDALREVEVEGNRVLVHEFFENTLVLTTLGKDAEWKVGTAGAQRSTYEKAIDKVLRHLAAEDRRLRPLAERSTLIKLGLESATPGKRGRPRKAV